MFCTKSQNRVFLPIWAQILPCHFLEGLASQIVSHILRMWRLNRPGYRLSWNHIVVGIATPKILNFLFMHLHRLSITCTTRHRMTSHGYKDSIHERPFGVEGGGGMHGRGHAWQGVCGRGDMCGRGCMRAGQCSWHVNRLTDANFVCGR